MKTELESHKAIMLNALSAIYPWIEMLCIDLNEHPKLP
jgi:hypothetical protein